MSATIVIPVYGAMDQLRACLDSLPAHTPAGTRVHVCDDASPDPVVPALIAQFREDARTLDVSSVRRLKNLGFVGNVNAAFAETAGDLILLNSDTLVSAGWFERIITCAQFDPSIATITPFSNNAEICSFPAFCRNQPPPQAEDVQAIAEAMAQVRPQYPDLPTAVGFCMFVRRTCLDRIGGFDAATFGRGYGEENDFCLRASAHGWRNVLCDNAYVVHQGGASFAALGLTPGGENLRRLLARYPDYNRRIAQFIERDPLAQAREAVLAALPGSLRQRLVEST